MLNFYGACSALNSISHHSKQAATSFSKKKVFDKQGKFLLVSFLFLPFS